MCSGSDIRVLKRVNYDIFGGAFAFSVPMNKAEENNPAYVQC